MDLVDVAREELSEDAAERENAATLLSKFERFPISKARSTEMESLQAEIEASRADTYQLAAKLGTLTMEAMQEDSFR